jgi:hypothetical protein
VRRRITRVAVTVVLLLVVVVMVRHVAAVAVLGNRLIDMIYPSITPTRAGSSLHQNEKVSSFLHDRAGPLPRTEG